VKKSLRGKLTYANVMATLGVFLALGGGAALAAGSLGRNAVKSKNIAPKAVKSKNIAPKAVKNKNLAKNAVKESNLAKNAVTAVKVKAGSLTRAQLATGTIAGTQIAEFSSTVTLGSDTTAPQALGGTTTLTPAAGKSYLLLVEMQSDVSDVDGVGGGNCQAYVDFLFNGRYYNNTYLEASADSSDTGIFGFQPSDSLSTAIGLDGAGTLVTITEVTEGDSDCGTGATGQLRGTIVELG
jgi:hypothetical protein